MKPMPERMRRMTEAHNEGEEGEDDADGAGELFDGTPFDKLKSLPQENLRREDFAAVKSGRDGFSAMRKAKLIEAVAAQDYEKVCQALDKEKYQLSALRWLLRGLAERREAEWDDDDGD
jgi:GH24 family phage-related lysozyme (muramidase)